MLSNNSCKATSSQPVFTVVVSEWVITNFFPHFLKHCSKGHNMHLEAIEVMIG